MAWVGRRIVHRAFTMAAAAATTTTAAAAAAVAAGEAVAAAAAAAAASTTAAVTTAAAPAVDTTTGVAAGVTPAVVTHGPTLTTAVVTLANGVRMPMVGLGTWQLRGEECTAAVVAALAAGYRHIDTAAVYKNEEEVGAGIAAGGVPREDIFVTSKLQTSDHGEKAYDACLASLDRLKLSYLDCYLVHWPGVSGKAVDAADLKDERKASWLALQRLYREGRVRSIGVSNYMPWHLEELCTAPWCEVKPMVNQFEIHPLLPQADMVAASRRWGCAVEAYSSLARAAPELLESEAVKGAAAAHGVTPAQVALRWAVQQGFIVIPKSVQAARLAENAAILTWALSEDEMAAISALSCGKRMCWDPTKVTA